MDDAILIRGARLHNLKNLTVAIPKNKLVALSGLSGSGKSTLAFDTLHRERQRQYLESLGMATYAAKPQVDSITGLSPSISVVVADLHERVRLVVEHDLDVLRAADHLVDIGLGAGRGGGHVAAAGPPAEVAARRW